MLAPMTLEPHPRISIDPAVMCGKPVIRGTRVPVQLLVRACAEGVSIEELASETFYPHITVEDVRAALRFAADLAGETAPHAAE